MKKRITKKVGTLFFAIILIISMCISAFACDYWDEIGVNKEIDIYKSLSLQQQTVAYDGAAKSYNFSLVKGIGFECTKMIYYKHGCFIPVTPVEPGAYDVEFIFGTSFSVKIEYALIIKINIRTMNPCPTQTTAVVTTNAPTAVPTAAPTSAPTAAPTVTPTATPVKIVAAKTTGIKTTAVAKVAATKSNVLIAATGDNSSIYIYTIIFSFSLAAIIFISYKRHKEKMLNIE